MDIKGKIVKVMEPIVGNGKKGLVDFAGIRITSGQKCYTQQQK